MSVTRAVLRVVNSAGPTSSPVNQFALYRARTYPEEHNDLLSLTAPDPAIVAFVREQEYADRLGIHSGGGRVGGLVRKLLERVAHHRGNGTPLLIHLHHATSAGLVQLLRPIAFRHVPILYTVHSTFGHYSRRNRAFTRLNIGLADRVTFVSETSRRAYPNPRLPESKALVITNGVDLDRIDAAVAAVAARETPASDANLELITVGRLVHAKQQDFLLRLLATLPDHVRLTVVGDGELSGELRRLADELGVAQRIRFTGLVSRDTVFQLMLAADVFVSSSRWEGLPVAVLEAMAVGLPTVLSDIGPHRELADRSHGAVVLPVAIETWAQRLLSFGEDPAAREHLGLINRRAVEDHFSLRRMQADYTAVYEELWRRRPSR